MVRQVTSYPALRLKGVMVHAGNSYDCNSLDAIAAMAEIERAGAVTAAERIRADGLACPEVSVGSTPTTLMARSLEGVTEMRAGVYMFFDLVGGEHQSGARDHRIAPRSACARCLTFSNRHAAACSAQSRLRDSQSARTLSGGWRGRGQCPR